MKKKTLPEAKDVRSMKRENRPGVSDAIPRRVMFSYVGSTGWRRRRDLRGHKGNNKREGDFSHLHDKFTEEEA